METWLGILCRSPFPCKKYGCGTGSVGVGFMALSRSRANCEISSSDSLGRVRDVGVERAAGLVV